MKGTNFITRGILLTAIIALFTTSAHAADGIDRQLQKGLFEEEGNRDLAAAIKAYEAALKQFDDERQFASTAVFRLGECYRKQGKKTEAAKYYRRVLRDFSDQTNLVQLATIHLKASGQLPEAKGAAPDSPPQDLALADLRKELIELDVQIERVEALKKQGLYQSIVTLLNDKILASLISEHDRLSSEKTRKLQQFTKSHPEVRILETAEDGAFQQIHEHIGNTLQGLQIGKSVLEKKLAEQKSATWSGSPEIPGKYRPSTREEADELVRAQILARDSPDMVNRRTGREMPALHRAASAGQLAVAAFLIDNGADINVVWSYQGLPSGTPLHMAVKAGQLKLAEFLIGRNADINARNKKGETPLMLAVSSRFKQLINLLLTGGADANAANALGFTPLHIAAGLQDHALVRQLLDHGANPNALNLAGQTPLDLARHEPGVAPARLSTRTSRVSRFGGLPSPAARSATKPHSDPGINESDRLIVLLKKHGALEDVARAQYITATRNSTDTQIRVFGKSSHPMNRFTLTEFLHQTLSRSWSSTLGMSDSPFRFPDLTAVTINHSIAGKESLQTVNFLDHLRSDSSEPIWLEWGDSIEIPERAHPINDSWSGLENRESLRLIEKLHRRVIFRIGGNEFEFALLPTEKETGSKFASRLPRDPARADLLNKLGVVRHSSSNSRSLFQTRLAELMEESGTPAPNLQPKPAAPEKTPYIQTFWLKKALRESNVLLTTSDTGAIKIHRKSADAKETQFIPFDLDSAGADDIWLQDGDVIEIPEKK